MKKLFLILSVAGLLSLGTANVFAQEAEAANDEAAAAPATEQVDEAAAEDVAATAAVDPETDLAGESMHQVLKQKFIEGSWVWMLFPLLCFNTKKLIAKVEEALNNGGIEAAKEVCRNTRGPVASIFYQGLDRYDQGLDSVEKAVVSYGSVQTGLMENGLSWIGLFIALAPMLGFMGTVVGMIEAFDAIQAAGDISPTLVAGGIKVALLTTMLGLIAACILQLFYNYIITRIDVLVVDMEDSSITLVDMLTAYNKK